MDEALGQLAERSLLAFSLDGQTVTAHRMVLRVIREGWPGVPRQGRFTAVCRAAAFLLEAGERALRESQDRAAIRDIAEQVTALWETTLGTAGEADDELARMLLPLRSSALYYLLVLGDSAPQAILVGEPLTSDLDRVLGPDHPDTLASGNNLANAYRAAGRVR